MGMGASCNRWDCAGLGERPQSSLWYDCAGQPQSKQGSSSPSRERDWDPAELLTSPEIEVQLVCDRFAIHKPVSGASARGRDTSDWRRRYVLGRELGAGQTATVFEAFTVGLAAEEACSLNGSQLGCTPAYSATDQSAGRCHAATGVQRRAGGRRVALKRFHTAGTVMFQQELRALTAVGIHPHVLRLLESYQGGDDEDVLVLEHCDGGDVYELYAANNGCRMLEVFVLQLVQQLLLAIGHLVEQGVEHRDVKPENLLLYGSSMDSMAVPQLKLADFGWAVVVEPGKGHPAVPPEGVGSLWYAPPELNPPVEGVDLAPSGVAPGGSSDMWSIGIITYLLLVGHSPFNPALRVADPVARENEVIRLAALGLINTGTRPWACLSDEARAFICALVQPDPRKRLSPAEAWSHPFLARCQHAYGDVGPSYAVPPPLLLEGDRCERWRCLDGLQRLGWLAFARAVAEPEAAEVPIVRLFVNQQSLGSAMYLDQLAVELALAAVPSWFQPQAAFADVFVLAFNYLDCDADGILGACDLVQHVVGEALLQDAKVSAERWVSRWHRGCCDALPARAMRGLDFPDFRKALCASCAEAEGLGSRSLDGALHATTGLPSRGGGDAALQKRMEAIDEVCQRFLDEEFGDLTYGF
mmetsp:Transcript_135160/g.420056  ORF Transcript_135160/g.420056 Transcript_135160/m.420056 type:complete len:642 (+) Transcript_135160:56-1981(+)